MIEWINERTEEEYKNSLKDEGWINERMNRGMDEWEDKWRLFFLTLLNISEED